MIRRIIPEVADIRDLWSEKIRLKSKLRKQQQIFGKHGIPTMEVGGWVFGKLYF